MTTLASLRASLPSKEEVKYAIEHEVVVLGFATNATMTAFSAGFALFGATGEWKVVGAVGLVAFACGAWTTFRVLRKML